MPISLLGSRLRRPIALLGCASIVALALAPISLVAQSDPTTPSVDQAIAAADAAMSGVAPASVGSYQRVETTSGDRGELLTYVNYDLKINDHRVVGGEAVVVADEQGRVRQINKPVIGDLPSTVQARIAPELASRLASVGIRDAQASTPELVLLATQIPTPRPAYEVTVEGTLIRSNATHMPTFQHVFVDAVTGQVLARAEMSSAASEQGFYNGKVELEKQGNSYESTLVKGWQCKDHDTKVVNGPSNGQAMDLATACVDVQYAVEAQTRMYKQWFNRDGLDGRGVTQPAEVGLQDANAYWTGKNAVFGHNKAKTRQMTSLDVVGHEYGHGLLFASGRGIFFDPGIKEAASDIMGAALEHFANNPLDPPDYTAGEKLDFYGNNRPIRYMYQPSLDKRSTDCYEGKERQEHLAAGPMNHFFYLLAEGTDPSNGQPKSPTCNGTNLAGIGIEKAIKIWYNGTLRRTGGTTTWAIMRSNSVAAAKDMGAGSCELYNKTKAAWDAVNVKGTPDEVSCDGSAPTPTTGPSTSTPKPTPTVAPSVTPTKPPASPTAKPTTTPTKPRPTWTWTWPTSWPTRPPTSQPKPVATDTTGE